jgi:hypothetical protein
MKAWLPNLTEAEIDAVSGVQQPSILIIEIN